MTGLAGGDGMAEDTWRSVAQYLRRFASSTSKQKARMVKRAPLENLHVVALHHPDPAVRRECLFFLDHYANEASTAAFAEALQDPVETVRNAALHSIACESCRTSELCLNEVVPALAGVLAGDPSRELRTKAIQRLFWLTRRDRRAWEAIERAAEHDRDAIVRRAAADALHGSFVPPEKRLERRQRRHDQTAARAASRA